MLEPSTVRLLAAVMAAATVVGVVLFERQGRARHHRQAEFRAADNPPEFLQVLWPLLILVPQAYPILVALLPDLAYAAMPRFAFPGDSIVQVGGVLLWGFGGLLVVWAGRALGRFMMLQIAVTTDHELIESGPYARIRHPTYAGAMCLAFGVAVAFLSVVLLVVAIVAFLVANYRAGKEERLLSSSQGFGDRYRAYIARTGRFLPRLSK